MLSRWLQNQTEKLTSKLKPGQRTSSGTEDSALAQVKSLINSTRSYAQGRLELAKVEFQDLLNQLKPILALLFGLLIFAVFLLILLEVTLFASLMHFLNWSVLLSAAVMAAAHLLLLILLGLILRGKLKALKPFAQSQALQAKKREQASEAPTSVTTASTSSPEPSEVAPSSSASPSLFDGQPKA